MATISSYDIIKEMVDNNGHYYDDPKPIAIFEYTSGFNNSVVWSVAYLKSDVVSLFSSPYARNITPIWTQKDGVITQPTITDNKEDV